MSEPRNESCKTILFRSESITHNGAINLILWRPAVITQFKHRQIGVKLRKGKEIYWSLSGLIVQDYCHSMWK